MTGRQQQTDSPYSSGKDTDFYQTGMVNGLLMIIMVSGGLGRIE